TPTNTSTPLPGATATPSNTPAPTVTPTNTHTPTPLPTVTPTDTLTPTPTETLTPTPTETPTPTPTETPEPVTLTLTAPASITITGGASAPWTNIAGVVIGGVPATDNVTVQLSIAGVTPLNNAGEMRITGSGGFSPTSAVQTFTTTLSDANDRLTRLQYRRGATGTARMTIVVTHPESGQSRTVEITLLIVAP
ncbi:MAG: forkhead-associated protein, partial [Roseiflexus sp.]